MLVIDSGSSDRSLRDRPRGAASSCSRSSPSEFGHGRTRNLGAERTSRRADLLPDPGRDALSRAGSTPTARRSRSIERVGRGLRPAPAARRHQPDDRARADRVLRRRFAPDGGAGRSSARAIRRFLSNVNACYSRACWEEIRFRDVRLLRGPGVRRRHARGRLVEGLPPRRRRPARPRLRRRSSSCAATSTSTAACARRPATSSRCACAARRSPRGRRRPALDGRAGRRRPASAPAGPRARASTTSAGASSRALGSRAERLPSAAAQPALARGPRRRHARDADADLRRATASAARAPAATPIRAQSSRGEVLRRGRAASGATGRRRCSTRCPAWPSASGCAWRWCIPPFRRGSGGHNTLLQIFTRLERRGHTCSVWLADYYGMHESEWPAVLRYDIREFFAPSRPRLQGLRRLAGRRRRDRDRLADGPPDARCSTTAAPAPMSSTTTSPSSTRPRPSASLAARHLPPRPALHRREPLAARPADRALRRERRGLPARASSTTSTRRARRPPATTRSSTTRATRRRDGPCRSV